MPPGLAILLSVRSSLLSKTANVSPAPSSCRLHRHRHSVALKRTMQDVRVLHISFFCTTDIRRELNAFGDIGIHSIALTFPKYTIVRCLNSFVSGLVKCFYDVSDSPFWMINWRGEFHARGCCRSREASFTFHQRLIFPIQHRYCPHSHEDMFGRMLPLQNLIPPKLTLSFSLRSLTSISKPYTIWIQKSFHHPVHRFGFFPYI